PLWIDASPEPSPSRLQAGQRTSDALRGVYWPGLQERSLRAPRRGCRRVHGRVLSLSPRATGSGEPWLAGMGTHEDTTNRVALLGGSRAENAPVTRRTVAFVGDAIRAAAIDNHGFLAVLSGWIERRLS